MPDDVAEEKVMALRVLGADIQRVRPASIVDKKQVRNCEVYSLLILIPLPRIVCCGYFIIIGRSPNFRLVDML
jgi:hypothetical protein